MTDEEKELYMKYCKYDKEPKEVIMDLINLIEKQQRIIEEQKNRCSHWGRDAQKAVDYTFELNKEIEKKDKIIDEMVEKLSYVEDLKLDVCVNCKEDCRIPRNQGDCIKTDCIKEYFKKKVEEK